jgi:hypothetical protein
MEPEIDDDDLLVAAVYDPEAFAQFYRRHVRGVLAYFPAARPTPRPPPTSPPRPSRPPSKAAIATRPSAGPPWDGCTASRGAA